MGIEVNYRTCTLKKEIIDTLIDIHIDSSPVLIWQNEKGKRNVTKAKIESIDFATNSIILTAFSDEDERGFDQLKVNLTFYLRGDTKSIVFKHSNIAKKTTKGYLQLTIPKEVKMFENRSAPRQTFTQKSSPITAGILPGGSTDISSKSITVVLHDISLTGMGFFLEKKLSRLFFEKDKIKIERLGGHDFPIPILGNVIYASTEPNEMGQIKIGIKFIEQITVDVLNLIKF